MATKKNKQDQDDKGLWTPLYYQTIPKELHSADAWTYAAIARYCTMDDSVCRAAQPTLANSVRMPLRTFINHLNDLIKDGYILDLTPDNKASVHTYVINKKKIGNYQDAEKDAPWPDDWKNDDHQDDKPLANNKTQDDDKPWEDDWAEDDIPEDNISEEDKSIQKIIIPEDDINSKEINHLNHMYFKMINHKLVDTRISGSSEGIDNDE